MAGPWTYPLDLPALVGSDSEMAVGVGIEIAGRTSNNATIEHDIALGFESSGKAGFAASSAYDLAVGIEASGTADVLDVLGPWTYPLDLPALPEGVAAFDLGVSFQTSGSVWQVIVQDVTESTYDDTDVLGGLTYRYRVIDANGNVVESGDVLFNPSGVASFGVGLTDDTTGRKGASSAAPFPLGIGMDASGQATTGAGGHCEQDFALGMNATGRKQSRIDAEFAAIVAFDGAGVAREAAHIVAEFEMAMGFECQGVSNVMPEGRIAFDAALGFETAGERGAVGQAAFLVFVAFDATRTRIEAFVTPLKGRSTITRPLGGSSTTSTRLDGESECRH